MTSAAEQRRGRVFVALAAIAWSTAGLLQRELTVGVGTQVNFPTGVGGKGSSGVSAVLSKTNGGIAYADVAYAVKNHFAFFRVQNQSGKYALPGNVGIAAAASTEDTVQERWSLNLPPTQISSSCSVYEAPPESALSIAWKSAGASPKTSRSVPRETDCKRDSTIALPGENVSA